MKHTLRLLLACLLLVLFSAGLAWGATVGPRFEGEKIVEVSSHLVHDTDDHEHTAGVPRSDDGRRRAGHRLVIGGQPPPTPDACGTRHRHDGRVPASTSNAVILDFCSLPSLAPVCRRFRSLPRYA